MAKVYFRDVSFPIKVATIIGCAAAIIWILSILIIIFTMLFY